MNKPYFTRKNLIAIAMAFFYSFLLLFVGLCIEGSFKFANEDNPIAMVAKELNFKLVSYGVSGYLFNFNCDLCRCWRYLYYL